MDVRRLSRSAKPAATRSSTILPMAAASVSLTPPGVSADGDETVAIGGEGGES